MLRSLLLLIGMLGCGQAGAADFVFAPYEAHPVNGEPRKVAVGDVTGDGRAEVVVLTEPSAVQFRWAIQVFPQLPTRKQPKAWVRLLPELGANNVLRLADLAHDGSKDIVLGASDGVRVLSVTSAGDFSEHFVAGPSAEALEVMDVDRDGHLDIVALTGDQDARILYGNGAGGFDRQGSMAARGGFGQRTELADVNGDGMEDLILVAGQGAAVYLHDAGVGFNPPFIVPASFDGWGAGDVVAGDFTGDGRTDLAMSRGSSAALVAVFAQSSEGAFPTQVNIAVAPNAGNMIAHDFDGDGREDVMVVHEGWGSVGLLRQEAGGLATEVRSAVPFIFSSEIAAGDLDNDGCQDAVVTKSYTYVVFRGTGCLPDADLAVGISDGGGSALIRLSNLGTTQPIAEPLLRVDFSTGQGSLQLGHLPGNCLLEAAGARTARIECLVATLPPQGNTTISIPVAVSGTGMRAYVTASAQATTDTPERSLLNNVATRRFVPIDLP